MKSLKFLSLILLCATSSLALILPALGVVPFPSQFVGANASLPDMTVGGNGPGVIPAQGSSSPALPPIQSPTGGSILPPTEPWRGATPSLGLSNAMGVPVSANNALLPTGYAANAGQGGDNLVQGSDAAVLGTKQKVGMGLWLLLAPLWLLSLFVWSVAPNPSGGNRSSFRRAT